MYLRILYLKLHTHKFECWHIFTKSNIRLFITHGGQMSSLEAIAIGVPLEGIPVYFDQMINVERAV
jgi:hypothetical protein